MPYYHDSSLAHNSQRDIIAVIGPSKRNIYLYFLSIYGDSSYLEYNWVLRRGFDRDKVSLSRGAPKTTNMWALQASKD